jgi:hypothetical protein
MRPQTIEGKRSKEEKKRESRLEEKKRQGLKKKKIKESQTECKIKRKMLNGMNF